MSKDDNSKRTGVTPSDYVRAGILFTLNVGDRAEQLTDADVARIADSVDRRFGTEQSPRTALQVGQVITYEGDTPPDGWERVEAGSAEPIGYPHVHGTGLTGKGVPGRYAGRRRGLGARRVLPREPDGRVVQGCAVGHALRRARRQPPQRRRALARDRGGGAAAGGRGGVDVQ